MNRPQILARGELRRARHRELKILCLRISGFLIFLLGRVDLKEGVLVQRVYESLGSSVAASMYIEMYSCTFINTSVV